MIKFRIKGQWNKCKQCCQSMITENSGLIKFWYAEVSKELRFTNFCSTQPEKLTHYLQQSFEVNEINVCYTSYTNQLSITAQANCCYNTFFLTSSSIDSWYMQPYNIPMP